ncbi:MAG: MoaD/ThiS family protein [Verrucomicrobiaceae bacterium]|nr:MoaD/ThiS family protein [Verrucomicrobiaceae bacterium]
MPVVEFTSNLANQTHAPKCRVEGSSVRECLQAVFDLHPKLRGYVLDDQSGIRQHVVVFVDGSAIRDRRAQLDAVGPESEIFVMQALSGG